MSNTDSSSEEENLDLLKEAADTQFMKDSLYKSDGLSNNREHEEIVKEEKLPSLRPQLDREQQYNNLKVTPEFQNFVAKHLRKMIDKQLEECDNNLSPSENLNDNTVRRIAGGIRLFGSSENYLSAETLPSREKRKRKRHVSLEEDTVDNGEKCKSVAVSPEWITSGEAVQGWEKSTRGEVMVLNKSGEIIEHKGIKMKIKSNSRGVRNDSFHIDIAKPSSENVMILDKKEKKKQKRKKQREKRKLQKLTNGNVLHQRIN